MRRSASPRISLSCCGQRPPTLLTSPGTWTQQVWDWAILAVLQQIRGVDLPFARALHETHVEALEPYADTSSTLAALRARDIRLGVVSNIGWDIRKCFEQDNPKPRFL